MVPFEPEAPVELRGLPVLLLSGERDPILPLENATRLATILRDNGAKIDHQIMRAGHELTRADVEAARGG